MALTAAGKKKLADAQDLVIERLALGDTIVQAMTHVKRKRDAYYEWRRVNPRFADRVDAIRSRVAANGGQPLSKLDRELAAAPSFVAFRKTYFGFDTFPHQAQIAEAFESAPPGSVTMIILPPEAGKTTVVEDFICKLISENPNSRNAVISEGKGHAEKILGRIKNRLEDDLSFFDLHRDFGPFHSRERAIARTWNQGAIKLLQAKGDERDYTVEARGSKSKIYGSRYDNVFLDDIQSVASINETPKLLQRYFQDWRTRPGKAGRIFITGTRVGFGDFYGELIKALPNLRVVYIPAINEEGESYFPAVFANPDGVLSFHQHDLEDTPELERVYSDSGEPLGWTLEELDERRVEVTEDVFELVYLMKTSGSVLHAFVEQEIRVCSDPQFAPGPPHRGFGPVIGIDPALGGVCAFVVASFDYEHVYLENIILAERLGRNEAIFDLLEGLVVRHHPTFVVIEANTLQGGIARDSRIQEMSRRFGFHIIEHQTRSNKWDPIIGVKSMSAAFKRREIRIPTGGKPGEQPGGTLFEPLVQQLVAWREDVPTKKLLQDGVMALWFVWLWWGNMRHTLVRSTTPIQRQGLPGYASRGLPGFRRSA